MIHKLVEYFLNMKKSLFLILTLFSIIVLAQVGIGNSNPRGLLDVNDNISGNATGGLIVPNTSSTNSILNPASGSSISTITGTVIYDTSLDCLRVIDNSGNYSNCSTTGNSWVGFNDNKAADELNERTYINSNVSIGTSDIYNLYGSNAKLSVFTNDGTAVHVKSSTSDLNGLLVLEKIGSSGDIDQFIFFRSGNTDIGSIVSNGSGINYNTTSDKRLKENIVPTKYSLNNLLKIDIKDYNYINDQDNLKSGVIAQDLFEIYPQAVTRGGDDHLLNPWQVDYSKLVPLLIKSVQDLHREIEELKSK